MDAEISDFLIYVGALGLSGLLLIVLAIVGIGNRAINGIIGLAAAGYAAYLGYQFMTTDGFSYQRFIFAYILPFVAVFLLIKGLKDRKAEQAAPAQPPAPAPEG